MTFVFREIFQDFFDKSFDDFWQKFWQATMYNDKVGEIFYIEDGEQYFENGKLNRQKLQGEIGEFIDFV